MTFPPPDPPQSTATPEQPNDTPFTVDSAQARQLERLSWTEDHVRELKRLIAVGRAQISEIRTLRGTSRHDLPAA
jgi:hypothetical protein